MDLVRISKQTKGIISNFLSVANLKPGNILVVGCSTSEIIGSKIGSASNLEVAKTIFDPIYTACNQYKVHLAIQCCEHLNRSLVIERALMEKALLEEVSVIPALKAGGAMASIAMEQFKEPAVVEEIAAHAGIDIGSTLIGMHLKKVAVPIRLQPNDIGKARVVFAVTRPKLVGGPRAAYGDIKDKRDC